MVLPAIEALLGLLLLIGLRTRAALVAASLLIMVLTFGSALVQDWPAAGSAADLCAGLFGAAVSAAL